jgi:hypothetical protein
VAHRRADDEVFDASVMTDNITGTRKMAHG